MTADISLAPGEIPVSPVGAEPELIYHYTDPAGLQGVIKDKCLRAGDVWFMNDTREALYGLEVIERAVDALAPASDHEAAVRQEVIKQLAALEDQDDIVHSYIACLSKRGDDLSQWRAYGQPRGYSIGFDSQTLRRICPLTLEFDQPSYRVVEYDKKIQDGMVIDRFRFMLQRLDDAGDPYNQPQAAARLCILDALLLVPAFKHPAFTAEEEVRLHVLHAPENGVRLDLDFSLGQIGLKPYVKIDLRDTGTDVMTAIREVIVGPQPNRAEVMRAVKQLLAVHKISAEVRPSEVPLRP